MTTAPSPARYRIRSISLGDQVGLRQFYAGLSPDSRVARFHGASSTIPEAMAASLCHLDHRHREGIVAESLDATGERTIVGHVCIEPTDDDTVEMAIAVADAWHRRGVGRAILGDAIMWAQVHGVARLVASIQCGNAAMFVLLRSMGHPITYGSPVGGTVDASLDLRGSSLAA
jgi:GNAT superfamily N-acetyltransferase